MKIIFLDVDGVLNCSTTHPSEHHHTWVDWHFMGMDRRHIRRLNDLALPTKAKLVISSTWRTHNTPEKMYERLVSAGMDPSIEVIGSTPRLNRARHHEIKAWLAAHRGDSDPVERYVILDDDHDAGIGLAPNFVQTKYETGLTDELVAKAKQILES